MQSILITGSTGFLGSNIVQLLKHENVNCICSYNNFIPPTNNKISRIKLDLSKTSKIETKLASINPDIIIHTAALSQPSQCQKKPKLAKLINVKATEIIAQWCNKNSAQFIFTSTDMVYGGRKNTYSEEDKVNPINLYGQTKVNAEDKIKNLNNNYVILRLALMYGRGEYNRNYSSEWLERDLDKKSAQNDPEPVGLYTDQYRSMISVKNVGQIIKEIALKNIKGLFNLGGKSAINRYELGQKLCQKLNYSESLIEPVRYQDQNIEVQTPLDVKLDVSRAEEVLDTELWPLEKGLQVEYA